MFRIGIPCYQRRGFHRSLALLASASTLVLNSCSPSTPSTDPRSPSPTSASGYVRLGDANVETKNEATALEAYRNAIGLEPTYSYAHVQIGKLLLKSGRTAEAERSFAMAALGFGRSKWMMQLRGTEAIDHSGDSTEVLIAKIKDNRMESTSVWTVPYEYLAVTLASDQVPNPINRDRVSKSLKFTSFVKGVKDIQKYDEGSRAFVDCVLALEREDWNAALPHVEIMVRQDEIMVRQDESSKKQHLADMWMLGNVQLNAGKRDLAVATLKLIISQYPGFAKASTMLSEISPP